MDCLNEDQRHRAMKSNKSKNTKIEIMLRKALWQHGVRYRKNCAKILGKPDISIKKYKLAIFCDGEFWHGERDVSKCSHYWQEKIKRNRERDLDVTIRLRDAGWTVYRFTEKDIRYNISDCVLAVVNFVKNSKNINRY